jgi:hypothetical protein
MILAASGKYVLVLRNPNRPKDAGRADGMAASYGIWSVDETSKTFTRHVDGDMNLNTEGTDFKSTISINGDELRAIADGGTFTNVLRRVRQAQ